MSKTDKRVAELLEFPNTMRFSDVQKVLEAYGYALDRVKGSHHIFTKKGATRIDIPVHNKVVKIDYLKIIAKTLSLEEK